MEELDVDSVWRYLLEHEDLAARFPNWSSSVNLSDIAHILFDDTPQGQAERSVEEVAEVERLNEVSVQFKRYYLWVILVLGLPGNIASLLTFLHMRSLGSCVVYVAVLAVVDSLALVEKLALSLLQQEHVPFTPETCKILLYLANALVVYANWILVALAAERLFAVYRPLALTVYWTRSRASMGLAVLLILCLLACVPILVVTVPRSDAMTCVYAQHHRKLADAWNWVSVSMYGVLPCVSLLTINIAIISLLSKARRKQRELCQGRGGGQCKQKSSGDNQRQASVILLVASFVLIVLTTPRCALLLMQQLWQPTDVVLIARLGIVRQVTFALSDLNHSINFYLYFVSAHHFRRNFLILFRSTGRGLRRLSTRETVQRRISDSDSVKFVMVNNRPDNHLKQDGWKGADIKIRTEAL